MGSEMCIRDSYATFAQGGPIQIAVSDIQEAEQAITAVPERVPNFANLELIETDSDGYFFSNDVDETGVRWASRLQTWLELRTGDARQQEAASDLISELLRTNHEH